jgi:hypothetical protein
MALITHAAAVDDQPTVGLSWGRNIFTFYLFGRLQMWKLSAVSR